MLRLLLVDGPQNSGLWFVLVTCSFKEPWGPLSSLWSGEIQASLTSISSWLLFPDYPILPNSTHFPRLPKPFWRILWNHIQAEVALSAILQGRLCFPFPALPPLHHFCWEDPEIWWDSFQPSSTHYLHPSIPLGQWFSKMWFTVFLLGPQYAPREWVV